MVKTKKIPGRLRSALDRHGLVVTVISVTLGIAALFALVTGRWSLAFVAIVTLVLSLLPGLAFETFKIKLPVSFLAAISIFVFATIFMGEALNFYERVWWWDIALHGGSAIGFGLIGFLIMHMLFEGNRYAASPIAISFFAFCFAVTIGATWEVFEFGMDQLFGMNMQKSGLVDTMSDLMVDMLGASLGAAAGFLYLKKLEFGGIAGIIREFIRLNKRWFGKNDEV